MPAKDLQQLLMNGFYDSDEDHDPVKPIDVHDGKTDAGGEEKEEAQPAIRRVSLAEFTKMMEDFSSSSSSESDFEDVLLKNQAMLLLEGKAVKIGVSNKDKHTSLWVRKGKLVLYFTYTFTAIYILLIIIIYV